MIRAFTVAFTTAAIFWIGSFQSLLAEDVVIGKATVASQRVKLGKIDHTPWSRLLGKFVDDDGNVNYREWKASSSHVQSLDRYLNSLSMANLQLPATKNEKLAFWINAYNAVTIKGILREYPTSSIRNHTPRLFGYNIWKNLLLQVGDEKMSLDDIEHNVLRKMGDPRIHFAIVCASKGCPKLRNEAFDAAQLDNQLVENAKHFFSLPNNFRHDQTNQKFLISSIMKWFGKDFGETQAQQLKTIAPYLPTKEAYNAASQNSVRLSFLEYDWSLNEQEK